MKLISGLSRYSPIWLAILSGVVGARLLVTFDSYLYLASAKALFTADMVTNFHWIREPLYPFFLKIVLSLSSSGLLLSVVQSALLGLALFYLLEVLSLAGTWRVLASLLVFCNSVIVGFNGAVLQQSIFATILAVLVAQSVQVIQSSRSTEKLNPKLFLGIIVMQAVALLTSFFFVFVVGWLSLLVVVQMAKKFATSRPTWFLSLLYLGIPYLLLFAWWTYKFIEIGFAKAPAGFVSWPFQFDAAEIPISDPFSKLLGFLGLGPDTHNDAHSNESLIFSVNSASEFCGRLYPGPENIAESTNGYIVDSCRNVKVIAALSRTSSFWNFLNGLILAMGLALSTLGLFFRRTRQIAVFFVPAIIFCVTYYIAALGISRYSVPAVPALIVLVTYSARQYLFDLRKKDLAE